ncbi:hypothetical protein GY45DRAFT_1375106 [Cubamyces sp. BRFM 1775]|nr:hypothetical protein GY45DRAFT_1375106 [Cubamyces sp. BRFM 1775]
MCLTWGLRARKPPCSSSFKAILLAPVGAATTPCQALSGCYDTNLKRYLLTLQHVKNAFFSQGLDTFAYTNSADADYPTWVSNHILQIADHEAAHVADMTNALSEVAPAACTYNLYASLSPPLLARTDR